MNTPLPCRDVDAWLAHIEALHHQEIELGLGRITQVAERLDVLTPAPLTILVGGTNGKGSTAKLLQALLHAQGLKVGLYASPHIERYNERVSINDELISDADLCASFEQVERARKASEHHCVPLTYFEFGTLAALAHFKRQKVDACVLEIGLGGRLDAVNIVNADACVVTSIGLDHIDWLGETLADIAFEKCSIARSNTPFICGEPNPDPVASNTVQALGGLWYGRTEHFDATLVSHNATAPNSLVLRLGERHLTLPEPNIPYPNVASALMTLSAIERLPSDEIIARVVGELSMPGRLQMATLAQAKGGSVRLTLDVAHNAHACTFLAERLPKVDGIVLGMLADKDALSVAEHLPQTDHVYLVGLDVPRGQSALALRHRIEPALKRMSHDCVLKEFDSVDAALEDIAQHARDGEHWLVLGSFFTVQKAQQYLDNSCINSL